MNLGIGIDIGTFHTVSAITYPDGTIRPPGRSIPSIALRGKSHDIVGVDTHGHMESPGYELIQAPKLKMSESEENKQYLRPILRKLVEQSLSDLGEIADNIVLTVPPGWDKNQCEFLEKAIAPLNIKAQFQHEPSALLIAAMNLALKHIIDPRVTGKLGSAELVLVCDWGAGTVDVALVSISRKGGRHEFACVGEFTEMNQGGISIARDVIDEQHNKMTKLEREKLVYMLQLYWQDDRFDKFGGIKFNDYNERTKKRQRLAAEIVAKKTAKLLENLGITDTSRILCVLHGGPLEASFLRDCLEKQMLDAVNISPKQLLHIGNEFTKAIYSEQEPWRRDVLVAAGASLFASRGETLPEFEYDVQLKDSAGQPFACVRLAKNPNLAGIQVITPPYTGTDYYVNVQQVRRKTAKFCHPHMQEKTAVQAELRLHVRAGGVVMYKISEARVGYALIEAIEAQDLPIPIPFSDARSDKAYLPERSTRFSINMEQ